MLAQFQSPNNILGYWAEAGGTGQVITGRGQRQNVLAKLSMLLIDNEVEFKAEFNLPSHMSVIVHTLAHTLYKLHFY